ncbi:MAG: KpsF/GutQ family sugar-phosphate isomerase [Chlamydiae bacterium]|nr:KpsF/GutQ family sugar-phosphate isomerase [Chlamydiota bacterium]MBI3277481.1 KpsF/GutQ family sugar-phosphate isomerase [Chlamydiota bacterium]
MKTKLKEELSESLRIARMVIKTEAEAILALLDRIGNEFEEAVELLYRCEGKVIVTGMGKPGIIARKISATFNSTGTPSQFIHPAEASHGDLGTVLEKDVIVIISNSGETDEIKNLLPFLRRLGAKVIGMTGNLQSTLAKTADIVLDISIQKEACPLGLAPTASTTVSLVIGDALCMALLEKKGIKPEDYALFHPGGSLGKKLTLRVSDIMRTGDMNPIVRSNLCVKDVLLRITSAHAGAASVIDESGLLIGIFTDGDLRRHLEGDSNVLHRNVRDLMTPHPRTVERDKMAVEALKIMKDLRIDELPVIDSEGRPVGLLDVQDLIKNGIF